MSLFLVGVQSSRLKVCFSTLDQDSTQLQLYRRSKSRLNVPCSSTNLAAILTGGFCTRCMQLLQRVKRNRLICLSTVYSHMDCCTSASLLCRWRLEVARIRYCARCTAACLCQLHAIADNASWCNDDNKRLFLINCDYTRNSKRLLLPQSTSSATCISRSIACARSLSAFMCAG